MQILIRSDEDIHRALSTEQRLAYTICGMASISKRDPKKYFFLQCINEIDVKFITWYYKDETSAPYMAIEHHRNFWKGFYFEQLPRESFIKLIFALLKLLPGLLLMNISLPGFLGRFLNFLKLSQNV